MNDMTEKGILAGSDRETAGVIRKAQEKGIETVGRFSRRRKDS